MKQFLKRIAGADRPKVIAVIGVTRADVEAGVAHAQTGAENLPVWAWCGEDAEPVSGCTRFTPRADAACVLKDLRSAWPALTIVSWTGKRSAPALKLIALMIPPFRVVAFNEAGGFFAARPAAIAEHSWRRIRDGAISALRRTSHWIGGVAQWVFGALKWLCFCFSRTAYRIWSLMLAALGLLAESTGPLARSAVQRLTAEGRSRPALDVPSVGQTYIEVTISNRDWPRGTILKALNNADEDFIVLRKRGETASAEPLIALARETGSFAAAPQVAWSGWPETVATRHPFRRLQPGEVTEVAAPYSTLVVLRRDLFLRLGVPRALTYGTALMVLFRKANAAGLRNVVAGVPNEIGQEPAMALEDAEFAIQLALSRDLREAGSSHPARSRGNVAWSSVHRRTFRGKPRVLVVSPYLPFPLAHGGAVRIYNLCKALSHEIDFVLACFREVNDTVRYPELHEIFREVYAVDIDEKHPDVSVPRQVAEYRNTAMAELIRGVCTSGHIDIVQLEYTQMAEYREHTGTVPVILVEHDLTFTLHRQFANASRELVAQRQYELWHSFERTALRCSDAVWTMSESDRTSALWNGAPGPTTVVIPNGVDPDRFRPEPRAAFTQNILFVGSFRHLPNLLAFEALSDEIMPHVWAACPDAKLHIVAGPDHARAAALAGKSRLLKPDPRITIDGFVEDVRTAYRECDVAVIPLPISAGTNIKLMEAMACGKAVVSTPVGCHGMDLRDSFNLVIREIGPEFAAAVALLLTDELLRGDIGWRARRTTEERFDWNAIAHSALQSYATMLEVSPRDTIQYEATSI